MKTDSRDPDRWCSRTPCGQEFWQIISQWVWNLRLELGQNVSPIPLRTTEFASMTEPAPAPEPTFTLEPALDNDAPSTNPPAYGPPQWAQASFTGGFPGSAFAPQLDGTLLCPAGHVLTVAERRQERADSVRVSYAARIEDCRPCPLRVHCQSSRTGHQPGGSVPCIGPFHPTLLLPRSPDAARLPLLPVLPCFGVIGLVAKSDASGSTLSIPKPSR